MQFKQPQTKFGVSKESNIILEIINVVSQQAALELNLNMHNNMPDSKLKGFSKLLNITYAVINY